MDKIVGEFIMQHSPFLIAKSWSFTAGNLMNRKEKTWALIGIKWQKFLKKNTVFINGKIVPKVK
jgi:hypothetical protein